MAITRSSSGLLAHDAYASDTSADYTITGTATVGSGVMTIGAASSYAIHESSLNALCISGSVTAAGGIYSTGLWLTQNADMTNTADRDGYFARCHATNGGQVYRVDSNSATSIATNATTVSGGLVIRLWRDGTTISARYGATALANSMTAASQTSYTSSLYAGWRQNETEATTCDNLDIRTAHTVTCSGLPADWQFQVTDGTTTVKATAVAGTATVDASTVLFPFTEVMVLDAANAEQMHLLAATLADMGGGDAFAYAADATGNPYYAYAQM